MRPPGTGKCAVFYAADRHIARGKAHQLSEGMPSLVHRHAGCVRRAGHRQRVQEPPCMRIERHARIKAKLTECQGAPNRDRPLLDIKAVLPEERDGEAVHAKRDTAGMGDRADLVPETPDRSEMVEMAIKAHAGGRLLRPNARGPAIRISATAEVD